MISGWGFASGVGGGMAFGFGLFPTNVEFLLRYMYIEILYVAY